MRKHLRFALIRRCIIVAVPLAVECVLNPVAPVEAQSPQGGARIIPVIGPVSMDKDLRTLPNTAPSQSFRVQPLLRLHPSSGGTALPQSMPPSQLRAPAANMPGTILDFDGMNESNSSCNCLPPDPNGDIGRSHYIQAVNLSFQVFDKNTGGSLAGPTTYDSLFSALGTSTPCGDNENQGDPVVFYDQLADRWIISDFAFGYNGLNPSAPYYECIAVSKTGDPVSGGYWLYAFQFDASNPKWLGDYPKFGQWLDAYYMSANMFGGPFNSFQGVEVYALNRTLMLNGTGEPTPTIIAFTISPSTLGDAYSLLPARFRFGGPPSGTPEYFAAIDSPLSSSTVLNQVHIWKFHVDFANPSNSTFGVGTNHAADANITVNSFTDAFDPVTGSTFLIPQPVTSQLLDTLGDRLMANLWYQNLGGAESLWATHTVSNTGATGVRWYQFNVTGGTIATTPLQQQTFSNNGDGLYRWMPSLSLDDNGNMSIGYSVSSSSSNPSIRYAGRLRSDAANTLAQGETTLIAGGGYQTSTTGRWGDYSAMSIDPVDGCTFWYTQEYYSTTSSLTWNTRIGNFNFPAQTGCNSPTAVVFSSLNGGVTGINVSPSVMLRWKTSSEVNTAGFNLYRSERAAGPYIRVNSRLIPASGNPLEGSSYEFHDDGVARGKTYFYQIEEVELNGSTKRHTPVSVLVPLPTESTDNRILFPLGVVAFAVLSVSASVFRFARGRTRAHE